MLTLKRLGLIAFASFGISACGGDGVDLGSGGSSDDSSDDGSFTVPSVAFVNLYNEADLTMELFYQFDTVTESGKIVGTGSADGTSIGYGGATTLFTDLVPWEEAVSRNVVFSTRNSNTDTPLPLGSGESGAIFNVSPNRKNILLAYGNTNSSLGLRLGLIPFQTTRPANNYVSVQVFNNCNSFFDYEGSIDVYMTQEDGGERVRVIDNLAFGSLSSVVSFIAHPLWQEYAIAEAGTDPAVAGWLYEAVPSDGFELHGGTNYTWACATPFNEFVSDPSQS